MRHIFEGTDANLCTSPPGDLQNVRLCYSFAHAEASTSARRCEKVARGLACRYTCSQSLREVNCLCLFRVQFLQIYMFLNFTCFLHFRRTVLWTLISTPSLIWYGVLWQLSSASSRVRRRAGIPPSVARSTLRGCSRALSPALGVLVLNFLYLCSSVDACRLTSFVGHALASS